jgi:hypothetical protein
MIIPIPVMPFLNDSIEKWDIQIMTSNSQVMAEPKIIAITPVSCFI